VQYPYEKFRYDEGTAFMPVVSKKRQVPVHDKYNFMALDEDGYDIPSDWLVVLYVISYELLHKYGSYLGICA
jgi:hypothetical protein